jgi:hypothetical protein
VSAYVRGCVRACVVLEFLEVDFCEDGNDRYGIWNSGRNLFSI